MSVTERVRLWSLIPTLCVGLAANFINAIALIRTHVREFHATIADVEDDEHVNTSGLVQADDFNADVIVRFLRANGIDARVDEPTGGFRFELDDPARESHVRFACVCLRASISYAIEAAFWCIKAKR